MPDTQANQAAYPQQHVQKSGLGFPIARIVGLISLGTGAITDYAIGPHQGKGTGEMSLFSQLIDSLHSGDLLLADRCYSTYATLTLLSLKNIAFVSHNHAQKKSDFTTGQKLGSKDHLIEWKKPQKKPVWMSKENYDLLPNTLTVREFSVHGVVYVTTLLDEKIYPKKELVDLYKERWKIELDFRALKSDLKMEMLRCKTPEMVEKEIAVRFMAYNLVRSNMAASASNHNKKVRQLSFKASVQLLSAVQIQLSRASKVLMIKCYDCLLKALAIRRQLPWPHNIAWQAVSVLLSTGK